MRRARCSGDSDFCSDNISSYLRCCSVVSEGSGVCRLMAIRRSQGMPSTLVTSYVPLGSRSVRCVRIGGRPPSRDGWFDRLLNDRGYIGLSRNARRRHQCCHESVTRDNPGRNIVGFGKQRFRALTLVPGSCFSPLFKWVARSQPVVGIRAHDKFDRGFGAT